LINSVGIVGVGKLGSALLRVLSGKNLSIMAVTNNHNKTSKNIQKLSKDIKIIHSFSEIDCFPELLIITVQDTKIHNLALEIAKLGKNRLSNTIIAHCSGFLPLSVLSGMNNISKGIAVIHPYQTFHTFSDDLFNDVGWICSTTNDIKTHILSFIELLNGKVQFTDEINNFDNSKYHISAVFASNYLISAISYAKSCAELSGINPADYLPKIINTSVINSFQNDSENNSIPLTGPIVRGDLIAVKSHLETLNNSTTELKGYVLNGLSATEIAYKEKIIDLINYEKFKNLFLNELKLLYSL
jgi:predicted short-subunit dehydrogenase-like oxidoreductase (DUF2520 family)